MRARARFRQNNLALIAVGQTTPSSCTASATARRPPGPLICAGSVPRADPAENSGSPVNGTSLSGGDFFRHQPAISSPPASTCNIGIDALSSEHTIRRTGFGARASQQGRGRPEILGGAHPGPGQCGGAAGPWSRSGSAGPGMVGSASRSGAVRGSSCSAGRDADHYGRSCRAVTAHRRCGIPAAVRPLSAVRGAGGLDSGAPGFRSRRCRAVVNSGGGSPPGQWSLLTAVFVVVRKVVSGASSRSPIWPQRMRVTVRPSRPTENRWMSEMPICGSAVSRL